MQEVIVRILEASSLTKLEEIKEADEEEEIALLAHEGVPVNEHLCSEYYNYINMEQV